MESVINKLYYGGWGGQIDVKTGRRYEKQSDKAERCASQLEEILKENTEALETFRKFRDLHEEAICFELCDYYKTGFRNAVRLMTDALGAE